MRTSVSRGARRSRACIKRRSFRKTAAVTCRASPASERRRMFNFSENRESRVFHLMMVLPAGLLFLLSIISLGTLNATNEEFLKEYDKKEPQGDSNCILYAKSGGQSNNYLVKFQEGDSCEFSIAGGGILAALAVAFAIVFVVKAVIGVSVASITALIELAMAAAGAVWALIVASVITAGLNTTCQAYRDTYKTFDLHEFPCCTYFYFFHTNNLGDSSNVYFYESINASRITAWLAMLLLIALAGVYTCVILRYCFMGRKGSKATTNPPPPPSEEKDNPI